MSFYRLSVNCHPRCVRGAQGIGRLQGMPSLHPPPTAATLADMHLKPPDVGPHDGQLFLDLEDAFSQHAASAH